ncbi:PPOX class F420-dependent oxidoreductase [Mycobacterium palustre]|uniref:PPOX class F420-dependent oxidoreductase n=1 Tax=Mycobacterium palustre TaxID=153971 RepID=UPI000A16AF66|nr:PPOX class F420-dependent oxidoreductase [Mycobacterium palustre]
MAGVGDLHSARYVLLTTFRKDGSAVSSPVWAASEADRLFVWTETESLKVKRIRHNSEVLVQPCTHGGSPRGPAVRGRAELLDAVGTAHVRDLLARKYGIVGWLGVRWWPWTLNFGLSPRILRDIITKGRTAKIGLAITLAADTSDISSQ